MGRHIQPLTISMVILGVLSLENDVSNGTNQIANASSHDTTSAGHWGPWTEWSLCTRTCGYGTQYRLRRCHRLQNNVSCEGDARQFKICNAGVCPSQHREYRNIECAKHDHIYYGTKRYRWIPYINEESPCELSCKSAGYGYYARFKTTVEDGVICNEENTAMCFDGTCLKSGCDSILGSGSKEDICGVCWGSGDTCRTITGIYTRTHLTYRGYNIVAVIPAGARAINITEIGRSKNHLALSTPRGYFLNGHLRLQAEGEVQGAGTVFTYKRGRRGGCRGECLVADGPLTTALRVELIYFGRNPGIMYSYTVPTSNTGGSQSDPSHDRDRLGPNEPDTEPLTLTSRVQVKDRPNFIRNPHTSQDTQSLHQQAQGTQQQRPRQHQQQQDAKAPDSSSNRHTNRYSRINNTTRRKPSRKEATGRRIPGGQIINNRRTDQPTKGDAGNKTEADVHYRHYYHTNALDGLGDVPVKADVGGGVRSSYKAAKTAGDRAWRDSSHTGRQRRPSQPSGSSSYIDNNVPLPLDDDEDNNIINDNTAKNKNTRGSSYDQSYRRRVGTQDSVFSWRISGFTDCTESCGGGLQETRVVCVKSDSQVEVMDEDCDVTAKPETTTVVCNNQPCEPSWSLSQWSPCSVSCGRGLRNREVDCQQRISPTLTIPVSINNCPSPRPQARQYCQLDPCYTWKPSNWSQCSTVCGFGQRSRILTCIDTQEKEVKGHMCPKVKPTTEEICDMGSCAQGWFHSKWTKQCSAECGRGHYVRKVYCSAPDGSPLDENKCGGSEKKPRETKSCKAALPCGGQWFAGPWSKCNDTCGSNAVRHREILCIKQHGRRVKGITKEHNCDQNKKPADTEECPPLPACLPQWYMMAWSNCSKPCDTGVRTREVTCLDVNLKQSPDCDKDKKPSTRQSCNILPCQQNFAASSLAGKTQILQQDGTIIEVPSCEDKNGTKWCRLVSQARLCGYYKDKCCKTCGHLHHRQHHQSKG